jgi:hypothetical protein
MQPPKELVELTSYSDGATMNNFLDNTLAINSSVAFGSVSSEKVASISILNHSIHKTSNQFANYRKFSKVERIFAS